MHNACFFSQKVYSPTLSGTTHVVHVLSHCPYIEATGAFVNMQCGAKTYKYTRLNWLASRMLLQQKNRTLLEKKKKSYGITNVNMFDFEPQTNFRSCFQKSSSSNHDPSGKEINLVCLSRPPQSVAINISNHFDLQSIDQIRQDVENTIMEQVFI